jgi:hypothetical protein
MASLSSLGSTDIPPSPPGRPEGALSVFLHFYIRGFSEKPFYYSFIFEKNFV